jgi:uncharacterized protein YndB with AHSA1/START domain
MHGTLQPDGDRWTLRFTRQLPHPPEKVWRAITEPEHLSAWFPSTIDGERAAGAALEFSFGEGTDPETGEMLTFDPPKVMELRWGDDVLRFELQPDADGTILELLDTFTEQGKAARDAAGWHECLDQLDRELGGGPPIEWGTRWTEVHPDYVAAFGPEAATIGPPEGHDPTADR